MRNDICYATTNRQEAATELAQLTELVLVIGAQNSSNCARLKEVAEAEGVPAYLINGPREMDLDWFAGVSRVESRQAPRRLKRWCWRLSRR